MFKKNPFGPGNRWTGRGNFSKTEALILRDRISGDGRGFFRPEPNLILPGGWFGPGLWRQVNSLRLTRAAPDMRTFCTNSEGIELFKVFNECARYVRVMKRKSPPLRAQPGEQGPREVRFAIRNYSGNAVEPRGLHPLRVERNYLRCGAGFVTAVAGKGVSVRR